MVIGQVSSTAFLFFGPYSNLKFLIFTYTCSFTFFCNIIYAIMNLWIPYQKEEGARHTMQHHCRVTRPHNTCSDLITDKLHYCFVSIIAMFFLLTIVTYKGQFQQQVHDCRSMNVGVWCENHRQFPCHKVSNIRSHSRATMNQHLRCSKDRKWETKVRPWCTHCSYCGWQC